MDNHIYKKRIVLTGGGTAGHVTPNFALVPSLIEKGYEIFYVGSREGIEKDMVKNAGLPYYGISSGKLRRYLSIKNFTDPFRVVKGLGDAVSVLKKLKPDVIFSKGGFVTVPVVMAGKLLGIPVIIHESDITPGLANSIAKNFAKRICVTFPETLDKLPKKKTVLTGTPIRSELFGGSALQACKRYGFDSKPVVLVMGGSLGSVMLNGCIRSVVKELNSKFNILHICGRGNLDKNFDVKGYVQQEYISDQLPDALALASIVVSRAGANSISEFLALRKPSLLIPLSKNASRGDQILNAQSFEKQGFSMVLQEEEITKSVLISKILALYADRNSFIDKMSKTMQNDAVAKVIEVVECLY